MATGLDPSIITDIGNLNDPNRAATAQINALKALQAKQDFQAQNSLRQMLQQPGSIDERTGMISQNTMNAMMKMSPEFAYKLSQNQLDLEKTRAEVNQTYMGLVDDAGMPAVLAYDEAFKSTGSRDQALAAAQRAWEPSRQELVTSGSLPPDVSDKLPTQFNPELFKLHSKQYQAREAEQEKVRHDEALEALGAGRLAQGQERINIQLSDKAGGGSGVMTDQDMHDMAEQYLAGDKSVLQGMGYGSKGAANRARLQHKIREVAREQGMSGADVANKIAEFSGETAGQRTLGTRSANMEIAANEVKNMAPLALAASDKVDRTKYPNLNSILLAAEKGTGDENVVQFGLAANSLIYTYSKFLNPTGIPTDADKARATEILSTAWSKGQFKAAINQIHKEISSGLSALKTTKQEIHVDSGSDRDASVPQMPKQGDVQKGYRFKGGDPSKKESWEKVQ